MFADEVMETSTTVGATAYLLGGPPAGSSKQIWRSKFATAATVWYCAKSRDGSKWEIGYGVLTYGSPDQMSRTLVASSSGALIAWTSADVTSGYYIYSAPLATVWAALLLGTGFVGRPSWAQAGLRWIDWTSGIATRLIDKIWNGTADAEVGRFEGVPGIYVASPRKYWLDKGAANYIATTDDVGKVLEFDVTAANRTLTLPIGSSVSHGFTLHFLGYGGTNSVVLTPNVADKIDAGAAGATLSVPGGVSAPIPTIVQWDGAKSQWRTNYTPATILRGYLGGLNCSNDGTTPNTKLDVAAGVCADAANAVYLAVAAGTIDCTTVGANGLDAGALAASTWYHVFAIGQANGTTALLASTSASAPALPANYVYKRRIGSFKTDGSSHILAFAQNGDRFDWVLPVQDILANAVAAGAHTGVLASSPTGVAVEAILSGSIQDGTTASNILYISSLAQTDSVPSNTFLTAQAVGTNFNTFAGLRVMTDANQSVRYRVQTGATPNVIINTNGWIDHRGRDA